jgi:hypothetical protein
MTLEEFIALQEEHTITSRGLNTLMTVWQEHLLNLFHLTEEDALQNTLLAH